MTQPSQHIEKNGCCEKCEWTDYEYGADGPTGAIFTICRNAECACHSPIEKNWEEELYKGMASGSFTGRSSGDYPGLEAFIRREKQLSYQAGKDSMNDCTCKEKWTFGVVHRKDKPCYWPARTQEVKSPVPGKEDW